MRRVVAAWILATAALLSMLATAAVGAPKKPTVDVQLLAINDFHGNLEPPTGSGGQRPDPDGHRSSLAASSTSPRTCARLEAENPNTIADRRRRRPDRRQPAAVGAVPRRADHRGDERPRPRRQRRRQPRVRRGHQRAAAHAERRLPPDRRLPRRRPASPAPTSSTSPANVVVDATGKTLFPPYVDPEVPGRQGRLHRHDPRGHADHRDAGRRRRA